MEDNNIQQPTSEVSSLEKQIESIVQAAIDRINEKKSALEELKEKSLQLEFKLKEKDEIIKKFEKQLLTPTKSKSQTNHVEKAKELRGK